MAIARIITSTPELSGGLVRDLNSRGFEVHILSPEQTISGSADLEIRLNVAGTQQSMAEVFANNSLVIQTADTPEEDIWAMLAAYDGDAESMEQEEIVPAVLDQPVAQEAIVDPVVAVQSTELSIEPNGVVVSEQKLPEGSLITPVIAREEMVSPVETSPTQPIENVTVTPIVEPVAHKAANEQRYEIDPELVPSMFNFAGSSFESDAPAKETSATETSEEKPYIDGKDFRNLVAKKNGSWNFRVPKLVAAAGWAAVALLLLISFVHRHSPVPPEANASQIPFHATAPAANVVPVKSVMITNTGVPIKANGRMASDTSPDIAEDTIVHYSGKAKTHALVPEKHSNIKYYSDLD